VSAVRIQTERLVLRPLSEADVEDIAQLYSHPAVAAWLGPLTREDAARKVARDERHWGMHGFGRFAAADLVTGSLVGRVGVMRQPEWEETPEKDELGWTIAAGRWGEGLATEAAAAAMADAFGRVGLQRIVSWTTPDNHASRRVMEKCGLHFRGNTLWDGRHHVWYDVRATGRRA
jgi:RimJ/RimL family protein N-acetyltransferase